MNKETQQERIDRYLLGRSENEERLEIEEEVTRDAQLSEQLADTELAMAAIELAEDRALKARLQGLETKLAGTAPTATTEDTTATEPTKVVTMKPRAKSRRNLFAIAATLLLLLAVGWWALQPQGMGDPGQLAMASFEPYDNIAYQIERGSTEAEPEEAAFIAYEGKDYATAATAFAALPATAVNKFYLGQSELAQGNFAAAAAQFGDLYNADEFNLAQESAYFLALANLGEGKIEVARKALELIAGEAGHPMQDKAKTLLTKL